jgi:hypothetical protein
MTYYPSEPHIPTPPEDTACTGCDGDGYRRFMRQTPHGPVDDATECDECEGSGSGRTQWLNGYGPYADSKEQK